MNNHVCLVDACVASFPIGIKRVFPIRAARKLGRGLQIKEDSERSQETHLPNAHKSGLKSTNTVFVTQPSTHLNKYSGWQVLSANCLSQTRLRVHRHAHIRTFGEVCSILYDRRLLCWIRVFKTKYLTSEATGYEAVWKEQEAYSLLSKCEKTVIHLSLILFISEDEIRTSQSSKGTIRLLMPLRTLRQHVSSAVCWALSCLPG